MLAQGDWIEVVADRSPAAEPPKTPIGPFGATKKGDHLVALFALLKSYYSVMVSVYFELPEADFTYRL
jgi:hypothetical protein